MDLYKVASIIGFSIILAVIIGLIQFRKYVPAYQPFIYILCLALINHSVSVLMVEYYGSNTINGNIFVLLESLFYIWLFSNWGLFKNRNTRRNIIVLLLVSIWIVDNFILHNLQTANATFRIAGSFIMIFLAIEQLTALTTVQQKQLMKNASFIICCGMLIYFSYKAFIEVFFLLDVQSSLRLITNIYAILVFINCFVNLLFAWAVIWIPKKKQSLFLH